jgi:hypothetical protein
LSIEPLQGVDQPQMLVLNRYLNEKSNWASNNMKNVKANMAVIGSEK